jgi:hypothetical protein
MKEDGLRRSLYLGGGDHPIIFHPKFDQKVFIGEHVSQPCLKYQKYVPFSAYETILISANLRPKKHFRTRTM